MQVNLSHVLHSLHGDAMVRPSMEYLKAVAKYEVMYGKNFLEKLSDAERLKLSEIHEVPMTLGYLVCEALPKAIPMEASQIDKLKIAGLQRRVVKEGVQDFTVQEINLMCSAIFEYVAREFSFLAEEAVSLLDPDKVA